MKCYNSTFLIVPLLILLLACSVESSDPEPEVDTDIPYPIHKISSDADAPLTYKSLKLELTDNGEPNISASDGVIGMVCIGMSNANQECDRYIQAIENVFTDEVNENIKLINCALGSHAIERWNDPEYDSALWDRCDDLITQAGLTLSQVRIVLHKAANQYTLDENGQSYPLYPHEVSDFYRFKNNLSVFGDRVTEYFPNLQAVFTTSRMYGGYTERKHRGEPLSYEEGHALNQWLEENQSINGVWFGWGPYIWAPKCSSGIVNGKGFCYERSDFVQDAIHPASTGEVKVARMWHMKLSQYQWYTE